MNSILKSALVLLSAVFLAVTLGCASAGERTGMAVDDAVITTKVKAKLLEDQKLKAFNINVNTEQGIVQLSGFVDQPTDAERAIEVARTVQGVKLVRNDMRLK